MLTKRSLVFTSLAYAGTDLDFKQKLFLSFGRGGVFCSHNDKKPAKTLGSHKQKLSLVFEFLVRAGTDLDFKQNKH